jgi:hypothetical protein
VLHASKDSPGVRERVCRVIAGLDVIATAIVMDKRQLHSGGPWERDRTRFYNDLLAYLLADFLQVHRETSIVLSRKDYDRGPELQEMVNAIAARHHVILGRMTSFGDHSVTVELRPHASSRGLQAADYVAFAVFQAFERRNMTYYNLLQPVLGRVWDLARLTSYTRRNPMQNPP